MVAGEARVALYDWTFRLGLGVVVGNGLILGYMMWKTQLVPRFLSILGLLGGAACCASSDRPYATSDSTKNLEEI